MPSTPYDAKGLLKSAIRDDNPVVFAYDIRSAMVKGEVPDEEYLVPIGKGDIKREGKDVTVVAADPRTQWPWRLLTNWLKKAFP